MSARRRAARNSQLSITEAVSARWLTAQLHCRRDLALIRLMLDGGLRPGEVLGLHLTDIAYGRRRVTVRVRFDHPRGVRSKSRTERVVDLHEAATLEAVSAYVMHERPHDTMSPILFLVGGNGPRRHEALSYAALVRLFARASDRAGIRTPWVTRTRCATRTRPGCGKPACAS